MRIFPCCKHVCNDRCNVMNLNEFSIFRKNYCSLIPYLLLKPKSHIHHSCLINPICLDETTRIR